MNFFKKIWYKVFGGSKSSQITRNRYIESILKDKFSNASLCLNFDYNNGFIKDDENFFTFENKTYNITFVCGRFVVVTGPQIKLLIRDGDSDSSQVLEIIISKKKDKKTKVVFKIDSNLSDASFDMELKNPVLKEIVSVVREEYIKA